MGKKNYLIEGVVVPLAHLCGEHKELVERRRWHGTVV
jgi:hypothetical protein